MQTATRRRAQSAEEAARSAAEAGTQNVIGDAVKAVRA